MQPSPYTPGQVAREVPGRGAQLAEIDERLAYVADLSRIAGRIRVDHAARGIGKTSLLRRAQRLARERDLLTVWVTAGDGPSLVADLGRQIERETETWRSVAGRGLRRALSHLSLTLGVPGVVAVSTTDAENRSAADTATPARALEEVLRHTVAAARKEGLRGLVIFVDEFQSADRDGLRTLTYAWQHLQSESPDLPVAVFTAGLPMTSEVVATAVTFSERFAYRPLGPLDDGAVAEALAAPARALGVGWEAPALAAAVAFAAGYPHSVQVIGAAAWDAAGRPDPGRVITAHDVDAARPAATRDLEELFRSRWRSATPVERDIITTMAGLGPGPVGRADIAARLGTSARALSRPRQQLIDKGIIEAVGHGELDFTVPGFGEWVRRDEP